MIPMYLCNSGEDFIIQKYQKQMELMTSDNKRLTLEDIAGKTLAIVGNDGETVYAVYRGHRLAFHKEFARLIRGVIVGKTKETPQILPAATDCAHDCSHCKGCCGH